jgi:DNA-binding transcriptional MerR regulator
LIGDDELRIDSKIIVILMQPKLNNETLKIPAKLYRIGELVDYTPFSRQTIHNYTIMGLIQEAKWTEGGHRLYDESVFERLSEIIRLRKTKTLSEIREVLSIKDRRDSQTSKTDEKGRIEHESDVTTNG